MDLLQPNYGKQGFPYSSVGKESAFSAGNPGSIPGSGRSPGEGNGNPLQYSCLENPTEELGGLESIGRKEPDMTEQLHFHFLRHHQDRAQNKGQNRISGLQTIPLR